MSFRVLVAVCLLAGALAVAGCGGGDDGDEGSPAAQPDAWAEDVCTALTDWQQGIEERAQSLQADVFGAGGLAAGRDEVAAFLDDVVGMTDQLRTDIESAGVPAVEDGSALADDLQSGVEDVSGALADAKEDVENAPLDPQGLETALGDIGATLEQEIGRLAESFAALDQEYDVPELDAAFENAPACAGVQG